MALFRILILSFSVLFAIGCKETTTFRNPLERTPHETYSKALSRAGLDKRELGRRWLSVSESVLANPLAIQLPYEEVGWVAPDEVQAFAWQFLGRRGQRVIIELKTPPENRGAIFIDLFAVGTDDKIKHITDLDKDERRLDYLIESDAKYLIRLQPELLAGGRYELKINVAPSLAFPVKGKSSAAIGSFFGDPRDGGHREHHGVDIFAPRGTTAIAAADGIVSWAGDTSVGGNVVWLQDRHRSRTYYYAHLNNVFVKQGDRVKSGDPVGSVGNTGNARLTPPHLHFGIYEWFMGPVDPLPFIHEPYLTEQIHVADGKLNSAFRVTANRLRLQRSPDGKSPAIADLKRYTIVRPIAKSGQWYRVALANGLQGYVPGRYIYPVEAPLEETRLSKPRLVRIKPTASAPEIGKIAAGKEVGLYGSLGDFQYIKLPSGHFGWITL